MGKPKLKHGELDVRLNYIEIAQAAQTAIHRLQIVLDKLDVAAIQCGIKEKERRIKERRKK